MGESEERPPVPSPSEQPQQIVLEYASSTTPARHVEKFETTQVLGPFALGAMLPAVGMTFVWGAGVLLAGFLITWGLCAGLLIVIKVRGAAFWLRHRGRPWWVNVIAGFVNVLAFYFTLLITTARAEFSPVLGEGGTQLVALCLVAATAIIIGTWLTPRERG
jgi:hypothetical protein